MFTSDKRNFFTDWWKLVRVLKWLKRTINDVRIMGIDNMGKILTWIDASYATHNDMRSHTGGVISMGHGSLMNRSVKQKLNLKSVTEAEVIGSTDVLPYSLWLTYFLEAQGYIVKESIVYRDNSSAERMEKFGKASCSNRSRHIAIRYFFMKDRSDKGEIKLEHCPTSEMLSDYHTKPLQGKLFRLFREVIMGHRDISWLTNKVPSIKERAEGNSMINGLAGKG